MAYETTLNWKGGMAFEATPLSGNSLVLDSHPEFGGQNLGPTPVEALLSAAAACSGIDVLSILEKKKQKVTRYQLVVSGERGEEGTWPRPFVSIKIEHKLEGENLDPMAVERAVQLSDEKYCTVVSTLRSAPEVESTWAILDSVAQ